MWGLKDSIVSSCLTTSISRGENQDSDEWTDLSQIEQLEETKPGLEFLSSFSHNLKKQAMIEVSIHF